MTGEASSHPVSASDPAPLKGLVSLLPNTAHHKPPSCRPIVSSAAPHILPHNALYKANHLATASDSAGPTA